MTRPEFDTAVVLGNTPFTWQELVRDMFKAPITQALITNIDVRVFEGDEEVANDLGLDPTLHIYDTLQTDQGWDLSDGFNFQYIIASDLFTRVGGHFYRVEATLETGDTATGPIYLILQVEVVSVLTGSGL